MDAKLDRLRLMLKGKMIAKVDDYNQFTLSDGTVVYVDGGEDAKGGYGFLEVE